MRRWSRQFVVAMCALLAVPGVALADLQASTNYSMNESEVGGIGCSGTSTANFCGASTNYNMNPNTNAEQAGSTLGENAVGNSSSTNYQTNAGFNTSSAPSLTLCVGVTGSSCADYSGAAVSLGTLSLVSARTATAKFGVKNYLSSGYIVQIVGTAPTNNGRALQSMGTQSSNTTGCVPSCTPGTPGNAEQFGINLASNTNPATFGAGPVQNPTSSFSYGVVPSGYSTADSYRYFSGDTIASASKNSGETDYTISFMANITPNTPGGTYSSNIQIVATGTF